MRKLLGVLIVFMALMSCKTKYIEVPEYHQVFVEKHDTLLHRDSIFEKDSVYIIKSGDTITTYRTKVLYRDRWREKIVFRDSVRTDSIRIPYPVERKMTLMDRMTYYAELFVIISLIVFIVFFIVWLKRRLLARSKG